MAGSSGCVCRYPRKGVMYRGDKVSVQKQTDPGTSDVEL